MRRVVLDSNVLIDAIRGDPRALEYLRAASGTSELWSVPLVRTEVLWNIKPEERAAMQRLFDAIFWLDVTTAIADRAGAFGQRYGPSHGLDVIDATIAAAAEEINGDVATRNVRHFPMFPDLQPPY